MYVKGLALECKYTSKKGKTTLSYTSETRNGFPRTEKRPPKTSIVIVTAWEKGSRRTGCLPIFFPSRRERWSASSRPGSALAHEEALAKALLKSYW